MSPSFNAALGLAARANSSQNRFVPPTFWVAAGLGDSIFQGSGGYTNDSNYTIGGTIFDYICAKSGGRIVNRKNAGVAGNTTAQMLARFGTDIPAGITLGIVQGGTNDLGVLSQSVTIANIKQIALNYLALGCGRVVISAIPPKNTAPGSVVALNRNLAALAASLAVDFINPWTAWSDGNGNYLTGATADGVHPTQAVAALAAVEWLKQFNRSSEIIETPFWLPSANADANSQLYFGSTANSCYITDSNSDGTPDGWNGVTEITDTLVSATLPAIGKSFVLTGSSITAKRTVQRSIGVSQFVAGSRYVVVTRITSACKTGGCTWGIALLAAGLTVNILNNITEDLTSAVIVAPFTALANMSAMYCQFYMSPVASSGAGTLTLSQTDIYAAADLGIVI